MTSVEWEATSEGHTIYATLYGDLPARRAAILVHGAAWDASGWEDVAPRFVERGVPALAVDLRGHGKSTGTTMSKEEAAALAARTTHEYPEDRAASARWSAFTDLAVWKKLLRDRGAGEVALVGASLGGHAVLGSSSDGDAECVVSISAPVWPLRDELSRKVCGRKLYVCTEQDRSGAFPTVLSSFAALQEPKMLVAFGGDRHSRGMFFTDHGSEMLDLITGFVAKGL